MTIKPLDGIDFRVKSLNFPNMDQSETVVVHTSASKTAQSYHTKNVKETVQFSTTLQALDSSGGHELVPKVKQLVEDVLKDDYKPENAKIIRLDKLGSDVEKELDVQNCVIQNAAIAVAWAQPIEVTLNMTGQLAAPAA